MHRYLYLGEAQDTREESLNIASLKHLEWGNLAFFTQIKQKASTFFITLKQLESML